MRKAGRVEWRGRRVAALTVCACLAAALSLRCVSGTSTREGSSDAGGDSAAADTGQPTDSTTSDTTHVCAPGMSIACAGPGGCSGYQVCNAAGAAYDPCICPGDSGVDASGDSAVPRDAGAYVSDASADGPAVLSGSIQKGPFVLGSTVTLSAVDSTGAPTGQVFNTQTTTELGDFAVTFAYRGNVDMQAQGFYYDEVTGTLSTSPIVLRALYVVTNGGAQSAYINIITHLAHDRAVNLMGDGGSSLASAEAQAESELEVALGIGGTGFDPGGVGIGLNEIGANWS